MATKICCNLARAANERTHFQEFLLRGGPWVQGPAPRPVLIQQSADGKRVAAGAQRRSPQPCSYWGAGCPGPGLPLAPRTRAPLSKEGGLVPALLWQAAVGHADHHQLSHRSQLSCAVGAARLCRWDSCCSWGLGPTGLPAASRTHILKVVGLRVPLFFLPEHTAQPPEGRCSWPGGCHRRSLLSIAQPASLRRPSAASQRDSALGRGER